MRKCIEMTSVSAKKQQFPDKASNSTIEKIVDKFEEKALSV